MGAVREFILFPAIDLRGGKVVRLRGGDPAQETIYSQDAVETARRWIDCGAKWLHVVNLDAAMGEPDQTSRNALVQVVRYAFAVGVNVQVGGGIRSVEAIETLLELGVARVVLSTVAVEDENLTSQVLARLGSESIAIGLDVRSGEMQVRGWQQVAEISPAVLIERYTAAGLRWVIFTDVQRDGMLSGGNIRQAAALAQDTQLQVVLSGGVAQESEIEQARGAGLAGVILGKAIYSGKLEMDKLFTRFGKGGSDVG